MNWRSLGIKALALMILLSFVFVGCSREDDSEAEEVTDADAVVAAEIDLVSAEGQIVPVTETQLAFTSAGQVAEILVEEGAFVDGGTPLIRLDTTDQEIGVQQAEAALVQIDANVKTAEAGLLSAQAGLEAANIGVLAAQAQLALVTAEPTEEQIALSEAAVAIAEAGIGQAVGSQAVVLEGGGSAAIASAEARLVAAQKQFDIAQKTYLPILQSDDITDEDVIEQAQLQLTAAQANLAAAEAALVEARAGGTTSGDRTAAAAGVQAANSQRDVAQAQFDLLLAGAKEEQIAVAETGVVQAENAVAEAMLQVAAAEAAVSQAQAARAEAEAALAAAQSALDKRTITAPFAGTVANINTKAGQIVAPSLPVVSLADLSEWRVETTDLTELSVVNIEPGFEAEISIDAFPEEKLNGRVVDISSVSDLVRGDVTYTVTVEFDNTDDLPLRWGMTSFITVPTDQ